MIKKAIVSLFTLYQLSNGSSRMLLQAIPVPQPPVNPNPGVPEPVVPLPPVPEHAALPLPVPEPALPTDPPIPPLPIQSLPIATEALPIEPVPTEPLPVDPLPIYYPPEVLSTHPTEVFPINPELVTTTKAPIVATSIITPPVTLPVATSPPISTTTTTTTTAAPIPPDGFQFGAFGQLCPLPNTNPSVRQNRCVLPTDILTDANTGRVLCTQRSDCCMCSSIECGFGTASCRTLRVGSSGAFGVKDIQILGAVTGAAAIIDCSGVDSCRETGINGRNVIEVDCGAGGSCQDAKITITDPRANFDVDCNGASACSGLELVVNLSPPPVGLMCSTDPLVVKNTFRMSGIECNGESACANLTVTVNNLGCDHVVIDSLECIQHNSCNGAVFNLIGDVDITNCQCGPSCSNAIGLEKCFMNLEYLLCPDPLSCMGITKTITNPANEFELVCSNVQSCENANFIIQLVFDPLLSTQPSLIWNGFSLGGLNAARGATFTIDNQLGGVLVVEAIECGGYQSCSGTTFITGANVIIEDIICAKNGCYGCVIKSDVNDPGTPCSERQVQSPELIQPIEPIEPIEPIIDPLPLNPGPNPNPQNPNPNLFVPI